MSLKNPHSRLLFIFTLLLGLSIANARAHEKTGPVDGTILPNEEYAENAESVCQSKVSSKQATVLWALASMISSVSTLQDLFDRQLVEKDPIQVKRLATIKQALLEAAELDEVIKTIDQASHTLDPLEILNRLKTFAQKSAIKDAIGILKPYALDKNAFSFDRDAFVKFENRYNTLISQIQSASLNSTQKTQSLAALGKMILPFTDGEFQGRKGIAQNYARAQLKESGIAKTESKVGGSSALPKISNFTKCTGAISIISTLGLANEYFGGPGSVKKATEY